MNGEQIIKLFLIKNDIKYIEQKTFDGCKYINPLKFDFYLTDFNTCIEFDGEQHYNKFGFEKNNDNLIIREKRDNIKNEYCKNNNIKLIRFNLTNIKDIEKIIEKYTC